MELTDRAVLREPEAAVRDPLIVGDRLFGAANRLMSALHVERIAEDERDKAAADMVSVFDTAIEAAHEYTKAAWRECVDAIGAWAALRLMEPNDPSQTASGCIHTDGPDDQSKVEDQEPTTGSSHG